MGKPTPGPLRGSADSARYPDSAVYAVVDVCIEYRGSPNVGSLWSEVMRLLRTESMNYL